MESAECDSEVMAVVVEVLAKHGFLNDKDVARGEAGWAEVGAVLRRIQAPSELHGRPASSRR